MICNGACVDERDGDHRQGFIKGIELITRGSLPRQEEGPRRRQKRSLWLRVNQGIGWLGRASARRRMLRSPKEG